MEDLKEEPVQTRKRRRQTLHPVLMNRLKAFALPPVIALLLSHLANQCLHQEHDLDAIEFFAGRAFVTDSLRARGFEVAPYEIDMDGPFRRGPRDILSTRGFIFAVQLARRLSV